ncbi:PadR family transcriptional regulator [Nocardia sp. NPDC052566]|uniref:PadR family transcriptional regulator n=1 Tax=Nocardia sp. NPDC052566 TaxID=3364330 RepID=UPI0037C631DF
MAGEVRMTLQTLQVLQVLLDGPAEQHYGLKISQASGLPTGSIYPILTRLETAGWVTSAREDIDESAEGRRRRRYYQLTNEGATNARAEIVKAQRRLSTSPIADWLQTPQPGWEV